MSSLFDLPEIKHQNVDVRTDVPAKMRDGTVLYADVYSPREADPCPVLLMRTPYGKSRGQDVVYQHPAWYARFGYMVVVQDCRGRLRSGGAWYPYRHETDDTADTIAWAAALPGCNGSVGTYGFSYPGAVQLLGASAQPAGLKTIMPAMTGSDFFEGWTYQGGAFCQAFIQSWALYLAQDNMEKTNDSASSRKITKMQWEIAQTYARFPLHDTFLEFRKHMPYYWDWLAHDRYDDYWKAIAIRERYDSIKTPALHIGGWYDSFASGTIENFIALNERYEKGSSPGKQKLVMGPWYHIPWQQQVGAQDFGANGGNVVNAVQLRWLDQFLLGNVPAEEDEHSASLFVLFADRWEHLKEWPPGNATAKKLYLHSGGSANSLYGDGSLSEHSPESEPWDTYTYHPTDPVPSRGGHSCCTELVSPMGSHDQRLNEYRNDVLIYSTEVLEKDLLLMGEVNAVLFAASTASDTDFTAALINVFPCGTAVNIVNGIIRASYRDSLSKPQPIEPEKVYEYKIKLGWTSALVKAGHRLRLEISSSNFPHFDRHSNNNKRLGEEGWYTQNVARQIIFHDHSNPSFLLLPTVPS